MRDFSDTVVVNLSLHNKPINKLDGFNHDYFPYSPLNFWSISYLCGVVHARTKENLVKKKNNRVGLNYFLCFFTTSLTN